MRKMIVAGLIVATMASANVGAWTIADTYDAMAPDENLAPIKFRGLEWGMTREQVKQSEGLTDEVPYYESDWLINVFDSTVAGKDAFCLFYFSQETGGLDRGHYILSEEHGNNQLYYMDFTDLYEALVSIYGEPTLNADQWITDTYVGDEQHYGDAVANGHVSFWRGWKARDGSAVVSFLTGDNGEIGERGIFYIAPGYVFPQKNETDGL